MKRALALCCLLLAAAPAAAEPWPICSGGDRAARHVSCVVDGDTLWIAGEKIRLKKIDAAEAHGRCPRLAERGRDALAELMDGKKIKVVRHGADRYGRTLAEILVDGLDVGAELLERGLAKPYPAGDWCE